MNIEDIFRKEAITSKHKTYGGPLTFNNKGEKIQLLAALILLVTLTALLYSTINTKTYIPIDRISNNHHGEYILYSDFDKYKFDLENLQSAALISPSFTFKSQIKTTDIVLDKNLKNMKFFSKEEIICKKRCYLSIESNNKNSLINEIINKNET